MPSNKPMSTEQIQNCFFNSLKKMKYKLVIFFNYKKADLASVKYFGEFDMLSMPPATTTSLIPNWMDCAASIVAVN